jgi:hypothetical protein
VVFWTQRNKKTEWVGVDLNRQHADLQSIAEKSQTQPI